MTKTLGSYEQSGGITAIREYGVESFKSEAITAADKVISMVTEENLTAALANLPPTARVTFRIVLEVESE